MNSVVSDVYQRISRLGWKQSLLEPPITGLLTLNCRPKLLYFNQHQEKGCPINNLSIIKGRVFLGWTSTKLGLLFLLNDTMQWRQWGSDLRPLALKSSILLLSHCAPCFIFMDSHTISTLFVVFSLKNFLACQLKTKKALTYHSVFST